MTLIITYTGVVFIIAFCVGLFAYRSKLWHLVDIFYYPLAAVGVALLFISNTTQRQLVEVEEAINNQKTGLQSVLASKPDVPQIATPELVNISFRLITQISELASICEKVPRHDPTCSVAERMKMAIDSFAKVTNKPYTTPELKLASSCNAASKLLSDLQNNTIMSSLIGDELYDQYKIALGKQYNFLNYDAINNETTEFEIRAKNRLEWLRGVVKDKSESMLFVLDIYKAEIEFGKTIMSGLFPCISAPQSSIEKLSNWTISRQSSEDAIAELEMTREQIQTKKSPNPLVAWMLLNLWPMIIITALSLKFAKGVAALLKEGSIKPGT